MELKSALTYDPLTGVFVWADCPLHKHTGEVAGYKRPDGYIRIVAFGNRYLAHRLAWFFHYGEFPKKHLDHINGNPADNRIENLREVTHQQNMQNRRVVNKNSKSGLMGAYKTPRSPMWYARIFSNGKPIHLGAFESKEKAHEAYVIAKRNLHSSCTI